MKDRIINFYQATKARWDALEVIQKRRLVLAVSGLVVAIGVSIFFLVRPNWVSLLPPNAAHQTVQETREILTANNIGYRLRPGGRIEVRERDHSLALIEVTTNADSFSLGVDLFLLQNVLDEINMSTSDATRDQMFRRVDENEIALSLMTISGVENANVTIVQADTRSAFLGTGTSSASVVLTTQRHFLPEEALMMANMVASSVDNLTIDEVVITDQSLRNIFSGGESGDNRFGSRGDVDLRIQRTAEVDRGVRNVLSDLFSDVSVTSTIALDLNDTTVHTSIIEDPAGTGSGFVTSAERLEEAASGTGMPGMEVGAFANDGGFPGPLMGQTAGEMEASRNVVNHEYAFNRTETITVQEVGRLIPEESSVTAIVTNLVVIEQAQFESGEIVDVLNGTVTYFEDMTWEQFVLANSSTNVEIEISPALVTAVAHASGVIEDNVSLMGFYNFMFVDSTEVPIDWYAIILFGILSAFLAMLIFGLLRRNKVEEIIDIEPELSVEDLLVSTQIEELQEEADSLQEIAYSIDSEVKQQIDKFVSEKPEAVAQLLRSWMNEGWE